MTTEPTGLGEIVDIDDAEAKTLSGDVRDLILQEMRDAKDKPWTVRTEQEQWDAIERVDRFADHLIRKCCAVIAQAGRPSVPVLIEGFTVKKGLKITCTAQESDDNVGALMHGRSGFIVFGDAADFKGARAPLGPAPDQPDLLAGAREMNEADDEPVFDKTDAGKVAA